MSLVVDREARAALLERTASTKEQTWLQCLTTEGVGDWLMALPCKALSFYLTKQKFMFAAKYHMGLSVFWALEEYPVCGCQAEANNLRDHSLSCRIGGKRITRHNHVQDALFQVARRPAWCPCWSRRGSSLAPTTGLPTSFSGVGWLAVTPART